MLRTPLGLNLIKNSIVHSYVQPPCRDETGFRRQTACSRKAEIKRWSPFPSSVIRSWLFFVILHWEFLWPYSSHLPVYSNIYSPEALQWVFQSEGVHLCFCNGICREFVISGGVALDLHSVQIMWDKLISQFFMLSIMQILRGHNMVWMYWLTLPNAEKGLYRKGKRRWIT